MSSLRGLVLAAGASRRAGFAKALAELGGETLLARAIGTFRRAGCAEVLVVVGGPYRSLVTREARACRAQVVVNRSLSRGMFYSLQVGLRGVLRAVRGQRAEAVLVALVDHPHVRVETIRALVASVQAGATAAIPAYRGRSGHPYVLSRGLAQLMATSSADSSAATWLARSAAVVKVPVDDGAVLEDLDTPQSMRRGGVHAPGEQRPREAGPRGGSGKKRAGEPPTDATGRPGEARLRPTPGRPASRRSSLVRSALRSPRGRAP